MRTTLDNTPTSLRPLAYALGGLLVAALALPGCGGTAPSQSTSASESASASATSESAGSTSSESSASTSSDAKTPEAPSSQGIAANTETPAAQKLATDIQALVDASGMQISVSVLDLTTNDAAFIQSDQKIESASMIKVLIAETFLKQVAAGTYALDQIYTLQDADIVGGTGSLQSQGAGAEVTYKDLLHKMISESDNVATNVLITLCGMDKVNEEADALGLKHTELNRKMMDTEAAAAGRENYTCADDLTVLFKMVYDDKFVNPQMSAVMREALEAQEDNDCISKGLPAEVTFAHKTGSLATVRHDGGIVEGDKPFVIVTLCGGEGFNEQGAQTTMASIGQVAYSNIVAPTTKAVA